MSEYVMSDKAIVLATLRLHQPRHIDGVNRPYKVGCECGEWWYEFDHHLARVVCLALGLELEGVPNKRGERPSRVGAEEVHAEMLARTTEVLNDLIVTHDMWIDDDGADLDYLPEREARIADFIRQAAERLYPVIEDTHQRGYDAGCDDPESVWTSTLAAERERVAQWIDAGSSGNQDRSFYDGMRRAAEIARGDGPQPRPCVEPTCTEREGSFWRCPLLSDCAELR